MKKMKEGLIDFLKKLILLLIGWIICPLAKIYSWLSQKTGKLQVIGSLPRGRGFLFVCNHETFADPVEIFIEVYTSDPINFTNPILYMPWIMQAEDNFLRHVWLLKADIAIPIDRRTNKVLSRALALRKAKRILDNRGNIILFPGGMRDYHTVQKANGSEDKNSLGSFFDGAAWLAIHCQNIKVIPIGTRGYAKFLPNDQKIFFPKFWAKRSIVIGEPLEFLSDTSKEEITKRIREAILEQKNKEVRE